MNPMAEFLREKSLRGFGHVQRRDKDDRFCYTFFLMLSIFSTFTGYFCPKSLHNTNLMS